jgi:hypothetical protein
MWEWSPCCVPHRRRSLHPSLCVSVICRFASTSAVSCIVIFVHLSVLHVLLVWLVRHSRRGRRVAQLPTSTLMPWLLAACPLERELERERERELELCRRRQLSLSLHHHRTRTRRPLSRQRSTLLCRPPRRSLSSRSRCCRDCHCCCSASAAASARQHLRRRCWR